MDWRAIKRAMQYIGRPVDAKIAHVHLSNQVVRELLQREHPGVIFLHSTYEDSDVPGRESARALADFVESLAPGEYVLIGTGDYIRSSAPGRGGQETYDPYYRLYLVHRAVWEQHGPALCEADRAWRQARQAEADGGNG